MMALLALLAAFAAPLSAQTVPDTPSAAPDPSVGTRALIRTLKDESARASLIRELERSVEASKPDIGARESTGRAHMPAVIGNVVSGEAAEPDLSPVQHAAPSIGDRVLETVPAIATRIWADLRADWNRLRATARRLDGLSRIERGPGLRMLRDTALLVAVSFGLALFGRLLLRPVFRRVIGAARSAGAGRRLVQSGLAIAMETAILVIAAVSALALLAPEAEAGDPSRHHLYFSVSFFLAGMMGIALRAIFRPAAVALRPVPLSDGAARYWAWHLTIVMGFVTFGEIFVAQAVNELAGPITASAVTMTIHIVGAVYLAILIVVNRRAPAEWADQRAMASPEKKSLALIAVAIRYWHVAALVVIVLITQRALTAGDRALPNVLLALAIVAALSVAIMVIAVLDRIGRNGVAMPETLSRSMPTLGPRIDTFVRGFTRFLRFVIFFVWAGFTLRVTGFSLPGDWLEARFGFDVVSVTISLIVIVLVGYTVWLAVSSWIDYRLSEVEGEPPTARERTLLSLMRNAVLVAILLTALTYGLAAFGVSVAPLLASAGVVGLAIGFGSQKLVQDIINGLFIQFENAINVGDVVELGGRIGSVEKLTIRSVSLRDVQGVMHMIPFSSVDSVSNHTKGFSYHVADISIAYGADIDEAKDAMLAAYDDLAEDFEWGSRLLGGVEWFGVEALGDSAVVLRARLKTRPGDQWSVGRAYAERVKRRFDAAGVEIPYPQLKIWFDGGALVQRPAPLSPPAPPARSGGLTDADSSDDR